MVADHAKESQSNAASLELLMKAKASDLQTIGSITVSKNKVKLHWGDNDNEKDDEKDDDDDDDDDDDGDGDGDDDDDEDKMPKTFKKLISKEKGTKTGCATTPKEIKMLHEDDDEAAQVLVSEMDNTEWWTMVSFSFTLLGN